MKAPSSSSVALVLTFLSPNANIFANADRLPVTAGFNPYIPSALCCNTDFVWTPFNTPNGQGPIWSWQYCCKLGTDPNSGNGCDGDDGFNVGREQLSKFYGPGCGGGAVQVYGN
ncbi:uncharacterized protein SETTUDRAFT_39759 [Exserohilum turcica Et28A]|uniref:Uncharacterized protein n=1 Tax=Exserohilum turcicum (strain 28A) TaxID=671987 RepID=R0KDN5_EXST2|nr:uncharacterized protein SETTUDRAFT_39759 [Exserohilum turcica Et28A]EOA86272.1 hypothetical protein SETTUDRAFT_39759 [Exserohilum turcica Et28A]